MKSKFFYFNDEEIVFHWKLREFSLDSDSIDEIIVSTIQGKYIGSCIKSHNHDFQIDIDEISEVEIKIFAISNDITLKYDEGFHGGGETIFYKSKMKK